MYTYIHMYISLMPLMHIHIPTYDELCGSMYLHMSNFSFSDEEHVVESLPCNVPEDARAYLYSSWKNEFCPVAVPLLDRVKQHHTSLVPL